MAEEQHPEIVFRSLHAQAHMHAYINMNTHTHRELKSDGSVYLALRSDGPALSYSAPHPTQCTPPVMTNPVSTGQGYQEEFPSLPLFHLCTSPLYTTGGLRLHLSSYLCPQMQRSPVG